MMENNDLASEMRRIIIEIMQLRDKIEDIKNYHKK